MTFVIAYRGGGGAYSRTHKNHKNTNVELLLILSTVKFSYF